MSISVVVVVVVVVAVGKGMNDLVVVMVVAVPVAGTKTVTATIAMVDHNWVSRTADVAPAPPALVDDDCSSWIELGSDMLPVRCRIDRRVQSPFPSISRFCREVYGSTIEGKSLH